MKILLSVSVLAIALALVAGAGAAAKPPVHKQKKPTPTSKPSAPSGLCHLGQDTKTCNPNPLFAKTACNSLNPILQALAAPGVTFGKGYQPHPMGNGLDCFWKINGHPQAAWVHIYGGKNFSTTVGVGGKDITSPSGHLKWTLAEEFEWGYKQEFNPGAGCGFVSRSDVTPGASPPPYLQPTKTTVEGHEAYTEDGCLQLPQPDSPSYSPNESANRVVNVLDGDMVVTVFMRNPFVTLGTSADLIPAVEKIMSMYASTK